MNSNDDIPEEDKYLLKANRVRLCIHEWVDLYYGSGVSRRDPKIALATFYCKRCLKIVTKSYDQSMFKMNPEFEDENEFGL